MSGFTQENRFLKIETALPENKVLLLSFSGQEEISRPFRFQLDLISDDFTIGYEQVVGKNVTLGVQLTGSTGWRYFNGYFSRFAHVSDSEGYAHYQAEVVPWIWFLTRTSDCRIFQTKSVPDIVTQIFTERGFTDFQFSLTGAYPALDYCVQYRETAYNFVARLLEKSGIFYFFRHENGKHTLMLGDSASAFKPCPNQSSALFYGSTGTGAARDEDGIDTWQLEHSLRAGRYELNDYNFETPKANLQSNVDGLVDEGGNRTWQVYDYPGGYGTRPDGDALVKVRMDEEETPHAVASGAGGVRTFSAGFKFDCQNLPRRDQNGTYILTSVSHAANERGNLLGDTGGASYTYTNRFTCIPQDVLFRPARITPEPVVHGSQTAVVVGPRGEEIYTDNFGRVKVQFHWDRRGAFDEKSSFWIRVSQLWAGKGWGAMWIPRVGQEVIVDFLEGDPDQPIITGRVYNADQTPPYTLPDEKTKSAIKSYSSPGGGGFNELRFEDKKGSEQVFMNAQKDLHFRAKDSRFENLDGSANMVVAKDQMEKVSGDKHLTVTGDQNESVNGTVSLKTGQDLEHKVGSKFAVDAAMEVHIKSGMNLVVESGTSLTLKVGSNFININPAGVAITGTMVMINSGGAAGSGSGASPTAPKAPVDADTAIPGQASAPAPAPQPPTPVTYSPAAAVLQAAAQSGAPFCEH